jgi:hypothetical protein
MRFNAADFGRQMQNVVQEMGRAVEQASEEAVEAVGQRGLDLKQDAVETTYGRPEPRGSRRSGAWRSGQAIERAPSQRRIVTTGPAAAYEPYLADLPTGRDGVNRSNPAAERAAEQLEGEAHGIAEQTIEDSLRRSLG